MQPPDNELILHLYGARHINPLWIGKTWMKRGEKVCVLSNTGRARIKIFEENDVDGRVTEF